MSDDLIAWLRGAARRCMDDTFADAADCIAALEAELAAQREYKDGAYLERNKLVALLASVYPSGVKRTAIDGWSQDWHGCVYIDFPWGQASWHYHDSQADLFAHLPPYAGQWDGHTTEAKYDAIVAAAAITPPAGPAPDPVAEAARVLLDAEGRANAQLVDIAEEIYDAGASMSRAIGVALRALIPDPRK